MEVEFLFFSFLEERKSLCFASMETSNPQLKTRLLLLDRPSATLLSVEPCLPSRSLRRTRIKDGGATLGSTTMLFSRFCVVSLSLSGSSLPRAEIFLPRENSASRRADAEAREKVKT